MTCQSSARPQLSLSFEVVQISQPQNECKLSSSRPKGCMPLYFYCNYARKHLSTCIHTADMGHSVTAMPLMRIHENCGSSVTRDFSRPVCDRLQSRRCGTDKHMHSLQFTTLEGLLAATTIAEIIALLPIYLHTPCAHSGHASQERSSI